MRGKMIFKKMIAVFFIVCFITLFFYNLTNAGGWDNCKGCHNGNLAPDAKGLKDKYATVDKLVAAAGRSENSLMESIKKNEKLLRKAAKDIGLK
jgi:hypothetical protein